MRNPDNLFAVKRHWQCLASVLVLLLMCGCDEAFSPNTEFRQELVVYGFMNTSRDKQIVRVHTTYNPSRNDPLTRSEDPPVKGARVTISDGVRSCVLRDTLIARKEKDRYLSDIFAYVCTDLPILPGKLYRLDVFAPGVGNASAAARLPGTGFIHLDAGYKTLFEPEASTAHIGLLLKLSDLSKGYLLQFLIEYDVGEGELQQRLVTEIPVAVTHKTSDTSFVAVYPQLARVENPSGQFVYYVRDAYLATLIKIKARHRRQLLVGRHLKFYLYQLEPSLYDYYKVVNGFQDPLSIRTDKPDRTNIQGGFGVFGGMTVDSLIYVLPSGFFGRIR